MVSTIGSDVFDNIMLFLDGKEDIDREGVLKSIYIALQVIVTCDQSKTELVKNKLGDELFNRFSAEIKALASWGENDTEHKDINLIAIMIHTDFLKKKTGSIPNMKSWAKSSWKKVMGWSSFNSDGITDADKGDCEWLPHNCKARGLFPVVLCIMGIVTYVLDLSSDLVVGFDDYKGYSMKIGMFEIFLVLFTLIHGNIRSSLSLYETEKELLRIKSGRIVLETNDWEESQLNYHEVSFMRWLYMILWPFKVLRTRRGVFQALKAILFNILSLLMARPLVDRLIVLFHERTSLRSYYRHQVEQNSLNQFYLITEQLPELLIQFYTFQILLNNIFPGPAPEPLGCNQVFSYDKVLNTTNSFCSTLSLSPKYLIRCSTWFRIFSMSIPFINIPSGIASLEAGFSTLDPLTPKMSSKVKYLLQAAYTLMIPARVFLVAGITHTLPDKFYAIYYIIFRVCVELLINLFYHKATVNMVGQTKDGISQMLGKFWRLILFSIRDVFAISLRDPKAYMDKPSEVSYKSVRNWHSLVLRSLPFLFEGFFGGWFIENYYPCGKQSYTFKYLGWVCLLPLPFSIPLLMLLSDLLHPPRTKSLPTMFLKKSITICSIGIAPCSVAAMSFFFSNTKVPAKLCIVIVVLYILFFGGVIAMLFYDINRQTKKYEHSVLFSEDKTKNKYNKSCPLFCCPRAEGIPGNVDNYVKENSSNCFIIVCCPRARAQDDNNKIDEMDTFTGNVER